MIFYIDSQSAIIALSVTFSFFVFIILVIVLVAVYVRRKKHRSLVTVVDEWEINPGNVMLLEKIGEGFFGIVRKAYLYRTVAKPQTVQSEVGCDSSSDENKTVVACKMLKGIFLAIAATRVQRVFR